MTNPFGYPVINDEYIAARLAQWEMALSVAEADVHRATKALEYWTAEKSKLA